MSSPTFPIITHSEQGMGFEINQLKNRANKFLGYFWKLLWKMNNSSLKSSCIQKFQKTRGRVFHKWGRLMQSKWPWLDWKIGWQLKEARRQILALSVNRIPQNRSIGLCIDLAPQRRSARIRPDFPVWVSGRFQAFLNGFFCIFKGFRAYFLIF